MPQLRWEYKKVDDVPREGAMRQIDDLGLFWLPGEDDNAISARLTFDPASSDGIKLSIVGRRENSPLLRGGSHPRIHGIVKKDLITLDDCIPGKSSSNSSGVDYHSYRPNRMFIGHHLTDSSDRMRFDSVTVELLRKTKVSRLILASLIMLGCRPASGPRRTRGRSRDTS